MSEKNYKKKTSKMLFKNTSMGVSSCRKMAYQIKDLAKDLGSFENISEEKALLKIGFNENFHSSCLGEVNAMKKLGIVLDPFYEV